MQVLIVGDEPGLAEQAASGEARDGVTPPMRNACERIFRKPIDVAAEVVQKVEFDLLTILAVSLAAPMSLKLYTAVRGSCSGLPAITHCCVPGPRSCWPRCLAYVCCVLQGGAPEGLKFVDTEEEWVVDPATGQGAWLPVKR